MQITLLEHYGCEVLSDHSDEDLDVLPVHGDWDPQEPGEWVPLGDETGTHVFVPDAPVAADPAEGTSVQAPSVLRSQQEWARRLPQLAIPESQAKDFHQLDMLTTDHGVRAALLVVIGKTNIREFVLRVGLCRMSSWDYGYLTLGRRQILF